MWNGEWRTVFASAAAIRLALILYAGPSLPPTYQLRRVLVRAARSLPSRLSSFAVWHDSSFAVKYTDVDYLVFSDGARFIAEGGM